MTLLLLATSLLGLCVPGTQPHAPRRGHPRWWARLTVVSLSLGWIAGLSAIAVALAVAVADLSGGAMSKGTESHLSPGGPAASAAAAAVASVLAARLASWASRARLARRSARADGWIGEHVHRDDHELVLLPTSRPVAYSVAGRPRQIVVSEGFLDLADERLIEFVIEHERAHLRRHDGRLLLFAAATELAFRGLPLVRRSTAMLRLAVERAADEVAAGRERATRAELAARLGALASVIPHENASSGLAARARSLRDAPPEIEWMQAVAGAGVVIVAAAALLFLEHASSYVPALISNVGG